jgi:hypothetical protein
VLDVIGPAWLRWAFGIKHMRLRRLEKKLKTVRDEKSFLNFLAALAADRFDEVKKEKRKPSPPYCPGTNGWENGTIENFLASKGSTPNGA